MNIQDYKNYWITREGVIFNTNTKKPIKPVFKNGYAQVRLSSDGKVKTFSLHRLVYHTYKGQTIGLHINHINGIRTDNRLVNLEAITLQENMDKRVFLNRGEKVNTAKLTPREVMAIRLSKSKGVSTKTLTEKYHLVRSSINRIASGKNWKHLLVMDNDKTIWGDPRKTGAMTKKVLEKKYGKDYWAKITKAIKFKKHCETCICSTTKKDGTK